MKTVPAPDVIRAWSPGMGFCHVAYGLSRRRAARTHPAA